IERIAEPAAHLIARDDRGEHVAAGGADHLAHSKGGRHHRRARMQGGIRMGVVEVERVAERAVEQRRHRRCPGLAGAEHGGLALRIELERLQHLQQRGRRLRLVAGADGAAEEVERQHLGALQHFRWNVRKFQVGDITGKGRGFVGHRVSSFWPAGYAGRPALSSRRHGMGISYALAYSRVLLQAHSMPARGKSLFDRIWSWRTELALAIRITVAASAAYAIATALHLLLPLWAVLTSLIVTQMSVGRSLKATRDYMLGTIGGAIYGGAIAVLIPYSS